MFSYVTAFLECLLKSRVLEKATFRHFAKIVGALPIIWNLAKNGYYLCGSLFFLTLQADLKSIVYFLKYKPWNNGGVNLWGKSVFLFFQLFVTPPTAYCCSIYLFIIRFSICFWSRVPKTLINIFHGKFSLKKYCKGNTTHIFPSLRFSTLWEDIDRYALVRFGMISIGTL